jgi:hypothetical protein
VKFDWPSGPITTRLVQLVDAGNVPEVAAAAVGIGRTTFYRWVADGKGKPRGDPRRDFRDTLLRARALAEIRAVSVIVRNAERNPVLAMAWLAARNPRAWGRRNAVTLRVKGSLTHPVTAMSPEARTRLDTLIARAKAALPSLVVAITRPTSEG